MLRKLKVLVVVLAVTLAAASPALAQEAQEPETVTVTFQLSVDGQVPGWQHFGVDYPVGGEDVRDIPLCTTGTDSGMAAPPCRSGETYAASVEVPAGTPLAFDFVRSDTRTAPERFESTSRTFTQNTTVSAAYHFPGGAALDNGAEPDVGAGTQPASPQGHPESAVADQYAATPDGGEGSTPSREYTGSAAAATTAATGDGTSGNASAGAGAGDGIAGGVLPDTGGAALLLAGVGAILTAAGLLAYRRTR